jgi:hypothetical protein
MVRFGQWMSPLAQQLTVRAGEGDGGRLRRKGKMLRVKKLRR